MNLLFYAALTRIPLGICVALEFTGRPLLVATLNSRRPSDLAWVVLAVAGIVLFSPFAGMRQALDPVGVVLALGAGWTNLARQSVTSRRGQFRQRS